MEKPKIKTDLKEVQITYNGETFFAIVENLKDLAALEESGQLGILLATAKALSSAKMLNKEAAHPVVEAPLRNANNEPMGLNEMAEAIHGNAVNHGWWETDRSFGEVLALCHSELSEALEEYRNGNPDVYFIQDGKMQTDLSLWKGEKLEGIVTELADCIIRILDYCGHRKADIQKIIELKHLYNESRPYKHGGKKC